MKDAKRFKLWRIALMQQHRYRRYRALTMALTLAVLAAIPLTGMARLDLWGGEHWMLGRPVGLRSGILAVVAAIGAFYGVTFLINMFAGRMFCGFGCPVGQLSRFADAIDAHAGDRRAQVRSWLQLVGFALTVVAATVLWWVSPRVFLAADLPVVSIVVLAIVAASTLAVLHGRYWRWGFCGKFCPIGVYYSVVQTASLIKIDFDRSANCTECESCAAVCPVHLEPRRLGALLDAPGGIAFAGLPMNNHCLRCGACVEVCEHMMRKQSGPAAMGFRLGSRARAGVEPPPE